MQSSVVEHWNISKPAVHSNKGLVASQHHLASDVGAAILKGGGNAVDAAVATGLTLGTVEPWMSGPGGGGYMTVYLAKEQAVKVVEFGMRAPFDSIPEDYPMSPGGTVSSDSFNWPRVEGDVNIHGPLSVAVPGYIKGISLALENFGSMEFKDVIEPACRQAEWGLPIDWYSASKINNFMRGLSAYEESRKTYFPDGFPPALDLEGGINAITLGRLGETYRRLQADGPESYYQGEMAEQIASDLSQSGSRISIRDLNEYEAFVAEPLTMRYRDADIHVAGNLTAGPSILQALGELGSKFSSAPHPDGEIYKAYADALLYSYNYRLENLGEGPQTPTNTTHICASDSEGNVVSLTQTIMSGFGSRIMLPQTGILMNNGMMWFDPRPGGANSVVGGRHPLCNMCPVIGVKDNGAVFAAGACGGRKIFPAVFQLVSFLVDFGMDVNTAAHQPRLDVSGTDLVTIMNSLDERIIEALEQEFPHTRLRPNGVSPNFFALPQVIERKSSGDASGACFIPSPHARVSSAD
jgi:gamma-glutamyltranspeptidase / glutathione hydrolase